MGHGPIINDGESGQNVMHQEPKDASQGKNILNRLVSEEEKTVPQDINFTKVLSYGDRQRLLERRLKLTKALPTILQEMCQLENENDDKIELYTTQKHEFTVGLRMIIDQIDRILRKDDER